MATRLSQALGIITTLRRAGMIAPMRPDRYLKMAAVMRREGMGITSGFAAAAQRCPDRPGLVDELGTLTWRQLDERIDALAAALQELPSGQCVGIMCRNHRGFVEALVAATGSARTSCYSTRRSPGRRWPTWSTAKASTPSSTTKNSPRRWTARWPTRRTQPASWPGPTGRTS